MHHHGNLILTWTIAIDGTYAKVRKLSSRGRCFHDPQLSPELKMFNQGVHRFKDPTKGMPRVMWPVLPGPRVTQG